MKKRFVTYSILVFVLIISASQSFGAIASPQNQAEPIEISIVYAPESDLYMPRFIDSFNKLYENGVDPLTGNPLSEGDSIIHITGILDSSGRVAAAFTNSVLTDTSFDRTKDDGTIVPPPTIFQPSVNHWLEYVNAAATSAGKGDIFSDYSDTALAPVVIAIWKSRLEAIEAVYGSPMGWSELVNVILNPDDWCDDFGRTEPPCVKWGFTNPRVSSTARSTLITQYYIAASMNALPLADGQTLTLDMVENSAVLEQVDEVIKSAFRGQEITTQFTEYIAQGADYIDFIPLEENDVIKINSDPNRPNNDILVAVYPKDGTFIHGHPMGIVNWDVANGGWTTQAERDAAQIFIDYVLLPEQQAIVTQSGFRPALDSIPLGNVFNSGNGVQVDVDLAQLKLPLPSPIVIAEMTNRWENTTKPNEFLLVIDISGSMDDYDKLARVKEAMIRFLNGMSPADRVGLITFNDTTSTVVSLGDIEQVNSTIQEEIRNLRSNGATALFEALLLAIETAETDLSNDGNRRIIIVLTDGENTEDRVTKNEIIGKINGVVDSTAAEKICIVPVFYEAQNTDPLWRDDMQSIATAARTNLVIANPDNIIELLDTIDSKCD